jgi:hypothetical protein
LGRVDPEKLLFARSGASFAEARAFIQKVEDTKRVVAVQRGATQYGPPRDFARIISSVLDSEQN